MVFLKKFNITILFLVILGVCLSCVTDAPDPDEPEEAFKIAREYYDDENYEQAVQKLGEFKSKFPYSKYATLAELYIANSQFELGNYDAAAVEYLQFIKLHPSHPEVPFAMYRAGESYWVDAPDDIDRDQQLTNRALEEWQELLVSFPDSKYASEAKEKMSIGRRRLAEHAEFIAGFYCKQEVYHACAYRYIALLEEFKEYKDIQYRSLTDAAMALDEVARAKEIKPDSDKNLFHKQMSVEQIKDKAQTFRNIAQKLKPDVEQD